MKRLKHQQWENLFSALTILHSDIAPETLGERCLAAANKLISAEIIAFDFFTDEGVHTGKYWNNPPGAISEAEYAIFAHVAHEHPFSPDVFGKKRFDAMKTGDFLTTREFHRTAIYNEFFKICSVDNQLLGAFSDAPNSVVTFNFSRTKSDFSEEEQLLTNLFSQHLQIAALNAHKIERFDQTEKILNALLESKSSGVIVLNSDQKVVYESEFARRMSEKYFTREKAGSGSLPDNLDGWLKSECGKCDADKILLPPQVFKIEKKDSKLEICLMSNAETREITLLFEETCSFYEKMSECLNLTKREIEILFWISCGKTNKDIALILSISPRTVNKHTEHMYIKLGVETRTAAAAIALDKLGQ